FRRATPGRGPRPPSDPRSGGDGARRGTRGEFEQLPAATARRKYLVRIEQQRGVEAALHFRHRREIVRAEDEIEGVAFFQADAVFARNGAAEIDACVEDRRTCLDDALDAVAVAAVEHDV